MAHVEINDQLIQKLENLAMRKNLSLDQCLECLITTDETLTRQVDTDWIEQGYLLRLLTENAADLICIHEPDSTYAYVSPSIYNIAGYTPQELIGTNPYHYFHPDDITQIHANHQASLVGQQLTNTTYRFHCKNGSYVWLETLTVPVFDENRQVIKLVTISRDITERRQVAEMLKNERDLLQSITRTSPSGILVVDKTGQITYANPRAEEIMGLTRDTITSRTYNAPAWKHTEYDGSPWPDEKQPFVRVMQTKAAVWDVRHAIDWPDGRRLFLAINGAPILDDAGEVSQVVFTIEDYTQRKLQQDELEEALEREKHLNAIKSDFVSTVSHEFRTPMSVIMASTSLLRHKFHHFTEEDFINRLQKIEKQIDRLNLLIDDVTFISKSDIVGYMPEPTRIEVSQFFSQIVDEMQMTYPDHRPIDILYEGTLDVVLLDMGLMQKVFINLLSNALKYSPASSPVLCIVYCDSQALKVTIQDEGIGIPLKDQIRLFEDFHRASNVGSVTGTGLGLAIVKRAVEALEGQIEFYSEPGHGTQFIISLPHISAALA